MAKATLNSSLVQLSGSISHWTFRHTRYGTVVSAKADAPAQWSEKQQAHRQRMKYDARRFYRQEMADPVKAAHYRCRAKELGWPVSAFVMGGFMKHGSHFAELEMSPLAGPSDVDGRDGADVE